MNQENIQKLLPDFSLREYIRSYSFVAFSFEQAKQMDFLVMPVSHTRMVLFLGEPSLQKMGNKFEQVDAFSLTGLYSKPHLFLPTHSIKQVMIHFAPWGIQPFLDFPLSEITDSRADLRQIFKYELERLYVDLHQAVDNHKKKKVLDAFFLTQLAKVKGIDERIKPITQYILNTHGALRLNHLSKELFIGERTIQRLIHNSIGVHYKFFVTLVRLEYVRHLLNAAGPLNMTDVALRAGYFDQAHFIHEFQSVYGESPGSYLKKQQKRLWNRLEP